MLLLSFLLSSSHLVAIVSARGNASSVADKFPALKNIAGDVHRPGGQSFGERCCLLAVNASLRVVDGEVEAVGPFLSNTSQLNKQFPCQAEYNGDKEGAPEVRVPYSWCRENCPGWQVSQSKSLNQWVGPFVGFILPTVAFCLTIPRQQKLAVPDRIFEVDVNKISDAPLALLFAIVAGMMVLVDLVVWVAAVFTLAGPMLLSGLYEAHLDKRLALFVKENRDLDPSIRAYILYMMLAGNLDPPTRPAKSGSAAKPDHEAQRTGPEQAPLSIAWLDVRNLVAELKGPSSRHNRSPSPETSFDNPVVRSRSSSINVGYGLYKPHARACRSQLDENRRGTSSPDQRSTMSTSRVLGVQRTKGRLRNLLESQYSFGSTVGAPVLFYVGAFVYTLFDLVNRLGDNDASHALAFGMWWMTIPIVTIVAGCLLAGNNPNTLSAIVGRVETESTSPSDLPFLDPFLAPVYQTVYRPARMWDRGRNKKQWCIQLVDEYGPETGRRLSEMARIRKRDWVKLIGGTMFLIGAPAVLAFVTSYFTPTIGIGCRSAVFLLHSVLEFILVLLWVFNWRYTDGRRRQGQPSSASRHVWSSLAILCGTATVFLAVGGTVMQILGVFRNCLCKMPMWNWLDMDATILVSSNSPEQIMYAETTWLPIGAAATAFLCLVSFFGWWYQRNLRFQFRALIDQFDDTEDENESKFGHGAGIGASYSGLPLWMEVKMANLLEAVRHKTGRGGDDIELSRLREDREELISR